MQTFKQAQLDYRRQRAWRMCNCHPSLVADVKRHGTCLSGACPHAWAVKARTALAQENPRG